MRSRRTMFNHSENNVMSLKSIAALSLVGAALVAGCSTQERSVTVTRHRIPNSNFPIAAAVEIPAGMATVYLSGKVPSLIDNSRSRSDPAAFGGDTEAQTVNVLNAIREQLRDMGLDIRDVVKMQAYLVADPKAGGRMDFPGFMRGYTRFFGPAAQSNLPARSVFEVASLANPAFLVEIEVIAARPNAAR